MALEDIQRPLKLGELLAASMKIYSSRGWAFVPLGAIQGAAIVIVDSLAFGSGVAEFAELLRTHITQHRQMLRRRTQILAKGQNIDVMGAEVTHHLQHFLVGFAKAEHQPGLGGHGRVALFCVAQHVERTDDHALP